MQDLNVVLVQADQVWENKKENLSNYERLLKKVDADLIILPEMFHTGFTLNAKALAEKYSNSLGINWLKQMASDKNAAVYTSLIIEENNHFFNRGVFIYPDQKVISYDKRKCFSLARENELFRAGTKETIVSYKGWTIQLQICYDLRFPELARNRIGKNNKPVYDVIIYIANWPEKRSKHWIALLTARAIENQCYVLGVNRVGEDGNGLAYSGNSIIADALGKVTTVDENKERVVSASLSMLSLKNTRNSIPFLKDI